MSRTIRAFAVCLFALVPATRLSAAGPEPEPAAVEKDWVFLTNDDVRVGLLRSHGGAIGHLSVVLRKDSPAVG